jgi:hypothetical protein
MVAPERKGYAFRVTLEAAEALLRSLVGVADVSVEADDDGMLRRIVIRPAPGIAEHRVSRNVLSALKARFGIHLDPDAITIAGPEAETEEENPPAAGWPDSSVAGLSRDVGERMRNGGVPATSESTVTSGAPEPATVPSGLTGPPEQGTADETGQPSGPRLRIIAGHVGPVSLLPRLVSAAVEPLERGHRCRITVAVGAERFEGVAESPAGIVSEAELAARVTLDALRSARIPPDPMQLQGVTLVDLGGRPHVAVSLGCWNGTEFEPVAGAAPVRHSVADAAAHAVIGSLIAYMGAAGRGA